MQANQTLDHDYLVPAPSPMLVSRGRVSATGRLSLPSELRREVGLENGGLVRIEIIDGTIRIKTMLDVKNTIRMLAKTTGLIDKASVDDFLAARAEARIAEAN